VLAQTRASGAGLCFFCTCVPWQVMSDDKSTIDELKQKIQEFVRERDWNQYHDPKNLAEALAIEAGELMEHFLWKDKAEIAKLMKENKEYREEVSDELADVLGYVLQMSHETGIDLSEALDAKYKKNEIKYPVAKAKGRAVKYTKL
jgi:dCTP diphosphatase